MKWGYVFVTCVACTQAVSPVKKEESFNWAIQGVYSQLDCKNQPGKRPYYVDALGDDGLYHSYFLECR